MMPISFEQLFYGRGASGYAILGMSPGMAALANRVEILCGAVGTAGADYRGEPFLMSVPEGGRVIMACGRRGAPDSMGRATLFFHVLAAERNALNAAKADAFSLFEQGAFAEEPPKGVVGPLAVRIEARESHCATNESVKIPAVFRSMTPALERVREAVGERALDLSWATFAFQALQGFDVQVLSPRTPAPQTMNEYDASGKLLRSACAKTDLHAGVVTQGDSRNERRLDASEQKEASAGEGKENAMLKFSIALNIVLMLAVVSLFATRKSLPDSHGCQSEPVVVTNRVEVPLSDAKMAEIGDAAVGQFLDGIPSDARITVGEFNAAVEKLPKYEDIYGEFGEAGGKYHQNKLFLERLKKLVVFVNEKKEKKTP